MKKIQMKRRMGPAMCIALVVGCLFPVTLSAKPRSGDPVVLLHGLGRTYRSMRALENTLKSAGFEVISIDYPSRKYTIERLADIVGDQIDRRETALAARVHFVTHSLGGILVRWLHEQGRLTNIGRVVMLSPPNQGSEIVDRLKGNTVVEGIFGPAFRQLGTGDSSLPVSLGPVNFELGVITGTRSLNPLFSNWVDGEDDGKVSTARAKVAGMQDFIALHHSHGFIMNSPDVLEQVVYFLNYGRFDHRENAFIQK